MALAEAERVRDRNIETTAGWPTSHSMVVQLREALGLPAGALGVTPQEAWEEALAEARLLHRDMLAVRRQGALAAARQRQ